MITELDVVVVGAGHAGLGIGYQLKQAGVSFVIVERGKIGESWRSQRWDSFAVNTPNWMNGLPGSPYSDGASDEFYTRDELVASFERHASAHALPIRLGTNVVGIVPSDGPPGFVVEMANGTGQNESLLTRNVVVASGMMQSPKIPAISESFPDSIAQIHASDYRSAAKLPDGAVLIVGSGQSGCQIAEDLVGEGRTVYLSTSRVARVPRRYRGRDITEWMVDVGMWDQQVKDLEDPMMEHAAQPQVSGVGRFGRTVSLQDLQRQGVVLMGRLSSVTDGAIMTDDGLADHIAFADDFSAELKRIIDGYVDRHGLDAPPAEQDPIDASAGPEVAEGGITTLDSQDAGVNTVIWCTGFTADFGWLKVSVIDDSGRPLHHRGVSPVPGIYFLGFPWLHTRKSGVIFGIDEDARHVTEAIVASMS